MSYVYLKQSHVRIHPDFSGIFIACFRKCDEVQIITINEFNTCTSK